MKRIPVHPGKSNSVVAAYKYLSKLLTIPAIIGKARDLIR